MRVPLLGLLFTLLVVPPVLAQQNSHHTVPNSLKGFDKQYKSAFDAYEKAFRKTSEFEKIFPETDLLDNVSSVYKKAFRKRSASNKAASKGSAQDPMEGFRTFAIPEHWFTDVFGPEQGPNFAKQYSELFKAFQFSTGRKFHTVLGEDTAQVKTEGLRADQVNPLRSTQTSPVPLPQVQLFRVQHFTAPRSILCADCKDTYSEAPYSFFYVESFIYVDGAFRFVGSCDCPFWSPCSTNDPVFEGQLVK
jgi:hypothetical protein